MRSVITRWALLVPLGAMLACSSSSSTPEQTGTGAGVAPVKDETISHTYTVPSGEFVRIPLEGGATYRVELEGTGFRIGVRPVEAGTQDPLIEELVPGVGASGASVFTVKPRADGVYEFRSIAGDPARPMTMRLTREPGPTEDKPMDSMPKDSMPKDTMP